MTKKELIFNAGAKLFAQQSYGTVGIRDIANEAGVNSAMISYYYGGKGGLLRAIFAQFKSLVLLSLTTSFPKATTVYDMCDHTVRELLTTAKSHRDIFHIGLKELNRDTEELQDLRDELNAESWQSFSLTLERMGITGVENDDQSDMIFTATMGIIFSDYLLGGGTYIDDDALTEQYIHVITTMLKYGSPKMWE